MKSTMMSSPLLVNSILERAAALFPGVEIVSMQPDGSRHSYTYRDLRRRSRQLAAALQAAGIAKGDRVATLMWNGHEHLEAYFGVPLTGAVLHTLNLRLHSDELAYIVNHAQDRFLIVEDVLLDLFEQIRARVHFERVFVVDHGSGRLPEGSEPYEDFLPKGAKSRRNTHSRKTTQRPYATRRGLLVVPKESCILTGRSPCILWRSPFLTS
jgi:fatty-acyl-CoA synthase